MALKPLSLESPFTYIWHDSAGQTVPHISKQLHVNVKEHGLELRVPDNTSVEQPIILINSAANNNKSQNEIYIGHNSQAQVIEYLMADDKDSVNLVSTNIICANNSKLKHCIIQQARDNTAASQQSITKIVQYADSELQSNIFSFGGNLSRIELLIELSGANASCHTSSLSYTNDSESQQILLKIDHIHQQCTSKSIARGILKDKSMTDFVGRVLVHPQARNTVADLQIKNMLLSPKAQANNKPELEIYNDEVKCSHGSSTGQIDHNALFYMRSRGIDEIEAIAMLIAGFIQPVIESCKIPMIADYIKAIVAER